MENQDLQVHLGLLDHQVQKVKLDNVVNLEAEVHPDFQVLLAKEGNQVCLDQLDQMEGRDRRVHQGPEVKQDQRVNVVMMVDQGHQDQPDPVVQLAKWAHPDHLAQEENQVLVESLGQPDLQDREVKWVRLDPLVQWVQLDQLDRGENQANQGFLVKEENLEHLEHQEVMVDLALLDQEENQGLQAHLENQDRKDHGEKLDCLDLQGHQDHVEIVENLDLQDRQVLLDQGVCQVPEDNLELMECQVEQEQLVFLDLRDLLGRQVQQAQLESVDSLDLEVSLDCLVLLVAEVNQVFLGQQDLPAHLAAKDLKVNVAYQAREVNQD